MTPVGWDEKVGRVIVVWYFDHFTMKSIEMNPAPIGMYKTLGLWCCLIFQFLIYLRPGRPGVDFYMIKKATGSLLPNNIKDQCVVFSSLYPWNLLG